MKILFINQYFWPDMAATAQLLSDLAEDLAARGHEVGVIAGQGTYVRAEASELKRAEVRNGVAIHRVSARNRSATSTIGRARDYLQFLLAASVATMTWEWPRAESASRRQPGSQQGVPVLVCLSTPPFLGLVGLIARTRGWRFVQKIEDVYPDVAIALGVLRGNSAVARLSRRVSTMVLRAADATVVLDECMKRRLGENGRGTFVIPNWADGDAIRPDTEAGAAFRAAHDLADRFVILYAGNLGLAHRFDALLTAAADLSASRPELVFLFVGGGPRVGEVEDAARQWPNVRLLPYQPRSSLNALYSAADVHLVSVRDEVAGMLVPSKYPAALAAGRPVVLLGGAHTEMRDEILGRRIGWACAHRVSEIAEVIEEVVASPSRLKAAGLRARELFDEKYAREKAILGWERTLSGIAHGPIRQVASGPR